MAHQGVEGGVCGFFEDVVLFAVFGALGGKAGEGEVFDAVLQGFAFVEDAAALQFGEQGFERRFGALWQDEVAAVVVGKVVDGAEGGEVVGADAKGLL